MYLWATSKSLRGRVRRWTKMAGSIPATSEPSWPYVYIFFVTLKFIIFSVFEWNHFTIFQNGTLKIIDRKKHIFKLSQGEYIAPEKIENVYVNSQYVAQIFVHGEGLKSCTVAVVVPDVENVKYYAAEHGIPGTLSTLCNTPEIKKLIHNDIIDLGKKAGLKSFEQVQYKSICFVLYLTLICFC